MTGILALLLRFAVILLGYAVAVLAASAFLNVLSLGPLGWLPEEMPLVVAGSIIFAIPVVALLIGYFACIPAAVAILLAEVLRKRDWLFHAIAGAVVAAASVAYPWQSSLPLWDDANTGNGIAPLVAASDAGFVMTMIGSGIVGGIAYWLTAGRWAGGWRAARTTSPGPSGS